MRLAVAALGALLALAPPAVAAPEPGPLRIWSVSKIEPGAGKVPVTSDTQASGTLDRIVELGGVSLHPRGQDDRATEQVFSSADGARSLTSAEAPSLAGGPKGGDARLDELRAYVKRAGNASLKISISGVLLQAIDANGGAPDCDCAPIRAVARFRARAYSAAGEFFNVGGTVYLEGYRGHWAVGAATASDARTPFWKAAQFDVSGDASAASLELHRDDPLESPRPVTLTVPLGSIRSGELFAVHVGMEAEAIDERGGESYTGAFIRDPRHVEPGLTARGVDPRGASALREPRVLPRPAAHCPAGPRSHAGTLEFSAPAFAAGEASGTPMVLVTRTGGSRGAASVTVTARGTRTRVRFESGDTSPRLVEIPIREDLTVEPPERFAVSLSHPACARLGARRSAVVTIFDDDQAPPAAPQPSPPAATPTPAPVESPPPPGLDPTFGNGGRVSTPVGGGQGEAVVIQPDGGIVTAGWRTAGAGTDFALTRHDASGRLDTGFGAGGIATTDLGGAGDQACDAALLPGGGIVAVGRTDAAGVQRTDFGVARYTADGRPDGGVIRTDILGGGDQANAVAVQPDGKIVVAGFTSHVLDSDFAIARYTTAGTLDPSFDGDGIVTTDLGTRSDDARALAIQPDGSIVVAGTADDGIALARYTSGGTLDGSFGNGGIRITADGVANGVALMPGGEIEVAGHRFGGRSRDFLLLRYDAHGTLVKAVLTDVGGGDDFAENLVVDASGRTILVGRAASSTILDMALVSYDADGTLEDILTADFHGRGEFGQDLALDAAGRIVAAGFTANGADTEFALMRAHL